MRAQRKLLQLQRNISEDFFLHLVDTALVKTRERFSYMENFFKLYGFLYSTDSNVNIP